MSRKKAAELWNHDKAKKGKRIFVSHSSIDKEFATWVSSLLVSLGVKQDIIFYSSDFRQGVREKISEEVRQALKETSLDIIVLSGEYTQSTYCLNEAGIIWFKHKESNTVVIALPQNTGYNQAGFIDNDYIQYRLLSENFLDSLVTRLRAILSKHGLLQAKMDIPLYNKLIEELREYKERLPLVENLKVSAVNGGIRAEMLKNVKGAWTKAQELTYQSQANLDVFYKDYIMQIQLYPSKVPNLIRVQNTVKVVIVNLSNQDHEEAYSSTFLKKKNSGFDTFEEKFSVDGQPYTDIDCQKKAPPIIDSPYITHYGPKIIVKAHTICTVEYQTKYDTDPELFFNSKVLPVPCSNYIVDANLDASFIEKYKTSYIIRCQFIPPIPKNLQVRTVPILKLVETSDKWHLHYESSEGFPAGGGYVLTLSTLNEQI